MKTIRQIAEEIGVSRQAIYKKIKTEPLSTMLQGATAKVDNVLHVSDRGEMLIKSVFRGNDVSPGVSPCDTQGDSKGDRGDTENNIKIIKILEERILKLESQAEVKDRQLEIKDNQIAGLIKSLQIQSSSISSTSQNQLAETMLEGQKRLRAQDNTRTPPKKGLFARLFKR